MVILIEIGSKLLSGNKTNLYLSTFARFFNVIVCIRNQATD